VGQSARRAFPNSSSTRRLRTIDRQKRVYDGRRVLFFSCENNETGRAVTGYYSSCGCLAGHASAAHETVAQEIPGFVRTVGDT